VFIVRGMAKHVKALYAHNAEFLVLNLAVHVVITILKG
jgi:hypothetical protein